jgi:hypothetical protein
MRLLPAKAITRQPTGMVGLAGAGGVEFLNMQLIMSAEFFLSIE